MYVINLKKCRKNICLSIIVFFKMTNTRQKIGTKKIIFQINERAQQ